MNMPLCFARTLRQYAPVLLLAFLLLGCASAQVNWEARVGNYIYDQAVLDYGPPDRSETLSDGTKVSEWLLNRGYSHGSVSTFGGSYYGGRWVHHYAEPASPDQFLRLTFAPDGKLKAWRKVLK